MPDRGSTLPQVFDTPSFNLDPSLVERDEGRRLQGTQASHDLLDMVHAHREMKPVEDGLGSVKNLGQLAAPVRHQPG